MKNYLFLGGWFSLQYAYVDLEINDHYAADSLFCRHKVPVRFGPEMARDGDKYRIVFCKIRRKHREEFEKALGEIANKMCLLGHGDYDMYCGMVMQMLEKARTDKTRKQSADAETKDDYASSAQTAGSVE